MHDLLAADTSLHADASLALHEQGFVVLPHSLFADVTTSLSAAYDTAVASAHADDTHIGRTSTRVNDFVNRGAAFDALYIVPPLLDACRQVVGPSFNLSSLHARTFRKQSCFL